MSAAAKAMKPGPARPRKAPGREEPQAEGQAETAAAAVRERREQGPEGARRGPGRKGQRHRPEIDAQQAGEDGQERIDHPVGRVGDRPDGGEQGDQAAAPFFLPKLSFMVRILSVEKIRAATTTRTPNTTSM